MVSCPSWYEGFIGLEAHRPSLYFYIFIVLYFTLRNIISFFFHLLVRLSNLLPSLTNGHFAWIFTTYNLCYLEMVNRLGTVIANIRESHTIFSLLLRASTKVFFSLPSSLTAFFLHFFTGIYKTVHPSMYFICIVRVTCSFFCFFFNSTSSFNYKPLPSYKINLS